MQTYIDKKFVVMDPDCMHLYATYDEALDDAKRRSVRNEDPIGVYALQALTQPKVPDVDVKDFRTLNS